MSQPRAYRTQQDRSRRTLDRILVATGRLLDDTAFEDITMQDVAAEAECAVGTLYCRVRNKDALLACLFERYLERSVALTREILEDGALQNARLADRADRIVRETVSDYAANKGIVRTIARDLFFRDGEDRSEFRRRATTSFRSLARFLAAAPDPIPHADRMGACLFALAAMAATAQNRIVFGERSGVRASWSLRELRQQLAHGLLSYLGTPRRDR